VAADIQPVKVEPIVHDI